MTLAPVGRTALGVLVVATLGERALTLWHPEFPPDGTFDYDVVSPIRDTWWAFHFFGGVALVMQSVAFIVAVCILARSRGLGWGLVGAVVYVLGTALFSAGIAGEGVAFAYATDPAAVPEPQGTQLLEYMGQHSELYVAGVLPGLALTTVGTVALCFALLRAGTIHWTIPFVLLVGTAAQIILSIGAVAFLISTATVTIPMLAIGWYAARVR
jgi:hypothetical protein